MMMDEKVAKRLRATLRSVGLDVESVAWIARSEDLEFAAIRVPNERPERYEQVLEFLTDPRNPLRVTREHVGRYDTRIYIAGTEIAR